MKRHNNLVLSVFLNLVAMIAACNSSKVTSTRSSQSGDAQSASGTVDYPTQYCANAIHIKTRTDISTEMNLLCKDSKPTPLLLELRASALAAEPGKIDVKFINAKTTEENDRSEYTLIWSFHVPIRPFEVKARPLYDFIAKGYHSNAVTFDVTANRMVDAPLDSGLHLWSTEMNYALNVKALPTLSIVNSRKTQYNLYQVLSGNEEMGLGVEHLIDSPDQTYKVSNLVNFSFNDGGGYNNGKGGAIVVNVLRFDFSNQGFPETATQTIYAVAQGLAANMYDGLKQ